MFIPLPLDSSLHKKTKKRRPFRKQLLKPVRNIRQSSKNDAVWWVSERLNEMKKARQRTKCRSQIEDLNHPMKNKFSKIDMNVYIILSVWTSFGMPSLPEGCAYSRMCLLFFSRVIGKEMDFFWAGTNCACFHHGQRAESVCTTQMYFLHFSQPTHRGMRGRDISTLVSWLLSDRPTTVYQIEGDTSTHIAHIQPRMQSMFMWLDFFFVCMNEKGYRGVI